MKLISVVAVGAALLTLSGCAATGTSASSQAQHASSNNSSVASATPVVTPTPTKAAPVVTAAAISADLQSKIPQVTHVLQITEDNDPNNLIGRPNEYTQAATLYDSRTPCTDIGADCGATIEIWPSAALATNRVNYIQTELKANPILGTEYDYAHGNAVLRVTGTMKPSDEAGYLAAWNAYFV
ncbi:hypothetical protein C8E83_0576 [Frondihabitans australicus]|uniref:LppP/LprE lipoprotein n=1 Tax=Frondihabitans australicus TaxID=386892 RepID=A0A495IBV1_9MICO|nr:hypothetical protein C8E83_0576 [Frondihabitans australicus]